MQKEVQDKAKKGLFRIAFSRIGIIFVLLLIQIGIFVGMTIYLQEYMIYIYGIFTILGVIVLIYIVNSQGNPEFKMTWMILIMAVPVIGTIFYVWVKAQLGTKFMKNRLSKLRIETEPYMKQDKEVISAIRASRSANAQLSHYLSNQLGYPTYRNTEMKYYKLGEEKFEEMLIELRKAQKFIFLEYFIVAKGYMWGNILKILKAKVKEGVEVRFMYDGMCAIALLPYKYPEELKKFGIQCKMASPVSPFLSTIQNNRDHRKICVIDGKVGFVGGVNLGDEYINRVERFGHWKDTAVKLEGDAVQSLTIMFLQMWNVSEKRKENYERYITKRVSGLKRELGYVIPYGDSPFDNENVGEEVYFHILNHAKKYVHIMTPYLILDNEMITTLTRAAKSGVEIIIIMPHIPDKWYAFAVAKTYYRELIEGGVQIYEYTPGFIHAKVFVSDDDTATVGTINLDYRSLYLHFENGVYFYNNSEIDNIERDYQQTLAKCHKITLMDVKKATLLTKIVGNVMRLFAPLM